MAVICGLFALFPERYLAESELMPQSTGGGLSSVVAHAGTAGSLLDLGSLVGSRSSIEADLTIARSYALLPKVAAHLRAAFPNRMGDSRRALISLRRKVNVVAIRGSILQVTARDRDPKFARAIVSAVASAIQDRLSEISVNEAAQRRLVTMNRLSNAYDTLTRAQQALTNFRLTHRLAAPEAQLGAGVGVLSGLQSQLQARQTQLSALRQVAAPNSLEVTQLETQIATLQSQIARLQASGPGPTPTLGDISEQNAQYLNLLRDERAADLLYETYSKYLEQLTIDEMSSNQSLSLIEPAFVHPERQYNAIPVALFFLVLGIAAIMELYMFRPPVGWPQRA